MSTSTYLREKRNLNKIESIFELQDFFMLRAPILPIEVYNSIFYSSEGDIESKESVTNNIVKFAEHPIFREALSIASPSLAQELFEINNYTNVKRKEKAIGALIRYLIRMTTRATPFGIFSGVALGQFSERSSIILSDIQKHWKKTRPDMQWVIKLANMLENNNEILQQLKIVTNPNLYICGDRIKNPYISGQFLDKRAKQKSDTVSIKSNQMVIEILKRCFNPTPLNEVTRLISELYSVSQMDVTNLIKSLLQYEILLTSLRPSLTDNNPFKSLVAEISSIEGHFQLKKSLKDIMESIDYYDSLPVGTGEDKFNELMEKMDKFQSVQTPLQVDLYLQCNEIMLDQNIKKEIEKAADLFWRLTPRKKGLMHLERYRNKFLERYGRNKLVPLLEVFDEDIGLGSPYNNLENNEGRRSFLIETDDHRKDILNSIVLETISKGMQEIILDKETVELFKCQDNHIEDAPVSVDLNFTILSSSREAIAEGDFLLCPGGFLSTYSSGQVFGRFTEIFHNKAELNEVFSKVKQESNPNSVIAEVSILPNVEKVANISIVKNMHPYEINLSTNTSQHEKNIPLTDILISCQEDHFYLHSKSLNKEIVPTKSHMFNFKRAKSPIYRFLCELEIDRQKNLSPFEWGPLSHFPRLPRIRYENIILSPAQWKINKDILRIHANSSDEIIREKISKWMIDYQVPRYVYVGYLDEQLLLDLNHPVHLDELMNIYKKSPETGHIKIYEAKFSSDLWVNNNKEHHFMECIFPAKKTMDKATKASITEDAKKIVKNEDIPDLSKGELDSFLPGSPWIFLKLYGSKTRQNELLSDFIKDFCQKIERKGYAQQSFFMRYRDPDDHIRLRFKGEQNVISEKLLPLIHTWALDLQKKGLLNRLMIDTYEPETERYGGSELINLAEEIFSVDSMIVSEWLSLIRKGQLRIDIEALGVISSMNIYESFSIPLHQQLEWLNSSFSYKEYLKEFREKRKIFIALANPNNNWLNLRNYNGGEYLYKTFLLREKVICQFAKKMDELLQKQKLTSTPRQIIGSILHLHLNRLIGVDLQEEQKIMCLVRHTLHNSQFIRKNEL